MKFLSEEVVTFTYHPLSYLISSSKSNPVYGCCFVLLNKICFLSDFELIIKRIYIYWISHGTLLLLWRISRREQCEISLTDINLMTGNERCKQIKKLYDYKTRIHSSGMRTTRSSLYRGVLCQIRQKPPEQRPPLDRDPLDKDPPGQRPPPLEGT